MSKLIAEHAAELLEWSRVSLNKMFDAVPLESYLYQPFPGANHALWTMGHLGVVDLSFMRGLGGPESESLTLYREQFFMKSKPLTDASAYPPIATIRKFYDDARVTLVEWIRSLDDLALETPTSERLRKFGPTVGSVFSKIAWHEAMHMGQLTVIRKSLGLEPLVG